MLRYFYFLWLVRFVYAKSYFCDLPCAAGEVNTACKRETDRCGIDPACGQNASVVEMDDESRQWVLDSHNKLRNQIALGLDIRGGNGKAANMAVLSYDKELEFVAQCWSNSCPPLVNVHDTCRSTSKFASVGQNMYGFGIASSQNYRDKKWIDTAVEKWYEEIDFMDASVIDSFHGDWMTFGHFTQLIWAKTTHIGCGRTRTLKSDGYYYIYFFCNYGTSGNLLKAPIYERGNSCSRCGKQSCNRKYPGLCGKVHPPAEDDWVPPFRMTASRFHASFYTVCVLVMVIRNFL